VETKAGKEMGFLSNYRLYRIISFIMMKYFLLFIFLFVCYSLRAQYKVRFILEEKTAIHHDSIFITGTFSNWDSTANTTYLLKPYQGDKKSIILALNPGIMRYKFHRGSWFTVEKKI